MGGEALVAKARKGQAFSFSSGDVAFFRFSLLSLFNPPPVFFLSYHACGKKLPPLPLLHEKGRE